MIEIQIKTNGEKIFDKFLYQNSNLGETSLVLFRLEQIKKELLKKEFKSDLKVTEEGEDETIF